MHRHMPTANDHDLSITSPQNGSDSCNFPSKHDNERPDNHDISSTSSSSSRSFGNITGIHDKYTDFPFVQSMMATEARRTLALKNDGAKQMKYPKSNSGFFQTLFILEGRALDRIFLPWIVATVWAALWAVVFETYFRQHALPEGGNRNVREDYIESILQIVMNTTLGFLLIFRLNRSATRFWVARGNWGIVIVRSRTMMSSILLHGSHDAYNRDQAIKWIAAFSIASMNHTRGITKGIDPETVEGVLTRDELDGVNSSIHPPLHAADRIRYHIGELFAPTEWDDTKGNSSEDTKTTNFRDARFIAVSDFRSKLLVSLEEQLNVLIDEEGAMERIKGTPLPIVYVTHLRTWLMLYLLSMPYFWEESLGFTTIPIVALLAFALLGLEGAAAEVEAPFRKDRTNHLDMNSYCLTVLSSVLQQIRDDADRRIHLSNRKVK